MSNTLDVPSVLDLKVFQKFFDLFHEESARKRSSEIVLSEFVKKHAIGSFESLSLAHQV